MVVFCIVCAKETKHRLWMAKKRNASPAELYGAASGIPGTQDLARCLECDFVLEVNRPSNDEIIEGYTSCTNEVHDSQFDLRVLSFSESLKRIQKFLPRPPAKFLDIGCAGGAFLLAAKECGYQVFGIEPSSDLVEHARKDRGLEVFQGVAENAIQIANQKFDVVFLWDVLEHVVDPVGTLDNAVGVLSPGGTLVINVPDMGTLLAKVAGKRNWWISSVHLYHFKKKHLEKLLAVHEMKLIGSKRFLQTLEFGYLLEIAIQMKVPSAGFFSKIIPSRIKKIKIKYYASQTTFVFVRKNNG